MSNYDDPRWQKLRLQVFERDGWKCCGCLDASSTLVAHHKRYRGEIWDSPIDDLQTVCKQCHDDFGKHPKGGVYWENENGVRVLNVTHCPICASVRFKDKGSYVKCMSCFWRSDFSEALSLHARLEADCNTPVLFGQPIRSVYLAGKIADPWRDELITNGEDGWSCNNHGIHGLLEEELDGSWSVLPRVVNVPGCSAIDLCGPFWNTSFDPHAGHGDASTLSKMVPHAHASTDNAGDWNARYLTMARCVRAINRCDLFFAWIDSMDAYGTLVEIGMARRAKCRIVVALGHNTNMDLWFASTLADWCIHSASAFDAWNQMWMECRDKGPVVRNVQKLLELCVSEVRRASATHEATL